jgi:hypothetical protein
MWQRFGTLCLLHLHRPLKMEQTECSEMLAFKLHMPENHAEESEQHSEHDESLKSRIKQDVRYQTVKLTTLPLSQRTSRHRRICKQWDILVLGVQNIRTGKTGREGGWDKFWTNMVHS